MSLKQRLHLEQEPVYLMDGSAFIYRGFFANRAMQRSDGFPTNALVVVFRILLRILREEQPRYFAFLLDGRGPNFRHEIFPLYKANRDAAPEDLTRQIEPVKRAVAALGLTLEVASGCEADDCIASVAARIAAAGRPVIIVSGDKDLRQCLGPHVFMWDPGLKEEKLHTLESFRTEYGLEPAAWADMQALMGDTADNIPGVPGIGPKTAEKIFRTFRSLEDIRDRLDEMEPRLRAKIEGHLDAAFMYRRLTRLSLEHCAHLGLEELAVRAPQVEKLALLTQEFELKTLRRDVDLLIRSCGRVPDMPASAASAAEAGAAGGTRQMSLFSLTPSPRHMPELGPGDALPDCAGRVAAVLFPQGPGEYPVLAVDGRQWRYAGDVEELLPVLSEAAQVVSADVKGLLARSSCWWSLPAQLWFDVGLAAYLIDPEESDYGWPKLAARWAGRLGLAAEDAGLLALRMAEELGRQLEDCGLGALYRELELPLIAVLARMEAQGVAIDARAFASFLDDVQRELDALTAEVHAAAGCQFNIRSAQQLGEVLFSTLQLPISGKTRGGKFSTDVAALEKLAGSHPVVDTILKYRKLEKMRSTYLAPLPRLMDSRGRIHTTFNQTATATGRLSSSNPNLQNIPVRGALGKRMRTCFVAGEGCRLVSADYSQVELRVLAHVSQEPALLEAFRRGEDIHTRTAALVFDLAPENVTPDQRRSAKTINFGLIYGMGAQKLARELHIGIQQARDFIEQYFRQLGRLREFYESVVAGARERGYVTTLAGRRRMLPDINSRNGQAAALARRQAVNTVIQGSAADVIKLAMLAVQEDARLAEWNARQVLQVHDELLLEVPAAHAEDAARRVAVLMASVRPGGQELSVPLLVDWGVGDDWGAAH